MTVDVVIINWNGRDDTLRSIAAVESQLASAASPVDEVGIILVDNGSTDGTAEDVLRKHPSVRTLRFHENRGFTGGIAAAIDLSEADLVIFLNNDAIPSEGWLAALATALAAAPADVVAVGGKIIDIDGERVDFIEGMLTFDGHAFQRDFRRPLGSVTELADGAELLFPCGGNMIVRRKAFLELGGFDDDYFAYLEDVDFGWRAWLSGFRVTYAAGAVVRHRSSATSDRLGAFERGVLFERNALQTAMKNFDPEIFASAAAPIFLTLLHRLHRYTVDRNRSTDELARAAFDDRGRATEKRPHPRIDDPLTAMQFRAMEWFFASSEHIMEKRARVQQRRTRSDREIFERFPLFVVPTYHGDEQLFASSLFRLLEPGVRSERRRLEEIIAR